jgi:hypothetical protein
MIDGLARPVVRRAFFGKVGFIIRTSIRLQIPCPQEVGAATID